MGRAESDESLDLVMCELSRSFEARQLLASARPS